MFSLKKNAERILQLMERKEVKTLLFLLHWREICPKIEWFRLVFMRSFGRRVKFSHKEDTKMTKKKFIVFKWFIKLVFWRISSIKISLFRNDVGSFSRFNIDDRTRSVSDSIKGNCEKFVDRWNVWHRIELSLFKQRFSFSFDLESNEENFFSIRKRKDSSRRRNLSSDNERLSDWTRQWKYCHKAREGKNDELGETNRRSICVHWSNVAFSNSWDVQTSLCFNASLSNAAPLCVIRLIDKSSCCWNASWMTPGIPFEVKYKRLRLVEWLVLVVQMMLLQWWQKECYQ